MVRQTILKTAAWEGWTRTQNRVHHLSVMTGDPYMIVIIAQCPATGICIILFGPPNDHRVYI